MPSTLHTVTIAGIRWRAHSPSVYGMVGRDIWLTYDGIGWALHGRDETGSLFQRCLSRDAGAAMLAEAPNDLSRREA